MSVQANFNNTIFKKIAISCFIFTGFIGAVAIIGWKFDLTWLVQLKNDTAPTQFNTAVCFVGIAIASFYCLSRKHRLSLIASSLVTFIASLTIIEYLYGVNLNIDELLHKSELTTKSSSPGRMAPNTALGFLIVSLTIIVLILKRRISHFQFNILVSLNSLVLAIAIVSILGYLFGIEPSYAWGRATHMSLQAAIGCLLMSVGLFSLLILNLKIAQKNKFHYSIMVGVVFLMVLALFANAIKSYQINKLSLAESSYRDLILRDVNLKWQVELVYLSGLMSSAVNSDKIIEQRLITNPSFQAVYIETVPNKFTEIFNRDSAINLSPLLREKTYIDSEKNELPELLAVEYSDLFTFNYNQYFVLKLSVYYEDNKTTSNLFVLINRKSWVEHYVVPLLIDGVKVGFSDIAAMPGNEIAIKTSGSHQDTLLLDIGVSNLNLQLLFGDAFFQNYPNLSAIVWYSGVVFTILSILITFFAHRSNVESKNLQRQILARKEFEQQLKKSNLSLKLASDSANLGIWTWDIQSGDLNWNEKMFDIYQTPQEVIDRGLFYDYWHNSVHSEDVEKASSSLQAAVDKKSEWQTEFRINLPDGTIKHIRASAICVTDNSTEKTMVFGANTDITEEKKLLKSLKEKSEIAEQHSLAKSRFLANMSHEIRTPMNAILGIGELIQSTELNTKQYEYIKLIMGSAHRLMDLLNDILDISKIEASELVIEKVSFPLEEVIADAVKSLATEAHEKLLDFHFFFNQTQPVWVASDPTRISQVVTNLVSNAIKFTSSGEITVDLNTALAKKNKMIDVELVVTDTGIGISQDQLSLLFQPFSQADESTTRKYGGTGLGLSIVKELVDILGGTIDIQSNPNKGVKVTIKFCLEKGSKFKNAYRVDDNFSLYQMAKRDSLIGLNCLVVDHHKQNRLWLTKMLHSWQCNVTNAENASSAITEIEKSIELKRLYNVLIVEKKLPDERGFEFVKKVNQMLVERGCKKVKTVIMLDAAELDSDIKHCEQLEISAHLMKPVKQSEVFNVLMSTLSMEINPARNKGPLVKLNPHVSLKVLVAEDHQINAYLVREILESRGHSVTIVDNGRKAVDELAIKQYDAILMDVQMPVMDGIEATKTIRQSANQANIAIIGLTARAMKDDAKLCIHAGMNYYLTKPVDPKKLIEVLENDDIRNARIDSKTNTLIQTADLKVDTEDNDDLIVPLLLGEPNLNQQQDEQDSHGKNAKTKYMVFNESQALSTTESDMRLLKKMMSMAVSSIEESLDEYEKLQQQQDWKELAQKIHKTKGMLSTFCHLNLIEEMEVVIQDLHANNLQQVNENLKKVAVHIKQLKQEMISYLEQL
jgi:signal transduction histidine kinase/CheY-like chemotaxis protein